MRGPPEVNMGSYEIDRNLLANKSTEEILRILKEERDDYTPEAIRIFEKILEARGMVQGSSSGSDAAKLSAQRVSRPEQAMVGSAADAIGVLNDLLGRVLDGTLEPRTGEVASNIVLAILKAIEQDLMTESEEES
jgi:hypothetical protein